LAVHEVAAPVGIGPIRTPLKALLACGLRRMSPWSTRPRSHRSQGVLAGVGRSVVGKVRKTNAGPGNVGEGIPTRPGINSGRAHGHLRGCTAPEGKGAERRESKGLALAKRLQ